MSPCDDATPLVCKSPEDVSAIWLEIKTLGQAPADAEDAVPRRVQQLLSLLLEPGKVVSLVDQNKAMGILHELSAGAAEGDCIASHPLLPKLLAATPLNPHLCDALCAAISNMAAASEGAKEALIKAGVLLYILNAVVICSTAAKQSSIKALSALASCSEPRKDTLVDTPDFCSTCSRVLLECENAVHRPLLGLVRLLVADTEQLATDDEPQPCVGFEKRRMTIFGKDMSVAITRCMSPSMPAELIAAVVDCLLLIAQGIPERTAELTNRGLLSDVGELRSKFSSDGTAAPLLDQLAEQVEQAQAWLRTPAGHAWLISKKLLKHNAEATSQFADKPTASRPREVVLARKAVNGVRAALGTSGRIKYTCISASPRYIALGASTGGVYCFSREEERLLQVVSNVKEGQMSCVQFAPDDRYLAFASTKGIVIIIEHNFHNHKLKPKRLRVSTEVHRGAVVTSLIWDEQSSRVFSADDCGRVGCIQVEAPSSGSSANRTGSLDTLLSATRGMLSNSGSTIFDAEAKVVQLDFFAGLLLISTVKRAVVFDTASQQHWGVGTKTRDGDYGSCFGTTPTRTSVIYSARPGSRVWTAHPADGTVKATQKFKEQLDCLSKVLLGSDPDVAPLSKGPQSCAFFRLLAARDSCVIACTHDALLLIDPQEGKLMGWHADVGKILDISRTENELFVLDADNINVFRISAFSPPECAEFYFQTGDAKAAAETLLDYQKKVNVATFCTDVDALMLDKIISEGQAKQANSEEWTLLHERLQALHAATVDTYQEQETALFEQQRLDTQAKVEAVIVINAGSMAASRLTSALNSALNSRVNSRANSRANSPLGSLNNSARNSPVLGRSRRASECVESLPSSLRSTSPITADTTHTTKVVSPTATFPVATVASVSASATTVDAKPGFAPMPSVDVVSKSKQDTLAIAVRQHTAEAKAQIPGQVVATTPAVTTPAVTTPAVTTPAVTTPAVTTPAVTTPAVTTPAVTTGAAKSPADEPLQMGSQNTETTGQFTSAKMADGIFVEPKKSKRKKSKRKVSLADIAPGPIKANGSASKGSKSASTSPKVKRKGSKSATTSPKAKRKSSKSSSASPKAKRKGSKSTASSPKMEQKGSESLSASPKETQKENESTPAGIKSTQKESESTPTNPKALQKESESMPMSPKDVQIDSESISVSSDDMQKVSEGTSTSPTSTPTQSESAPTSLTDAPTESESAPTSLTDTPTESESVAMSLTEAPKESESVGTTQSESVATSLTDVPTESKSVATFQSESVATSPKVVQKSSASPSTRPTVSPAVSPKLASKASAAPKPVQANVPESETELVVATSSITDTAADSDDKQESSVQLTETGERVLLALPQTEADVATDRHDSFMPYDAVTIPPSQSDLIVDSSQISTPIVAKEKKKKGKRRKSKVKGKSTVVKIAENSVVAELEQQLVSNELHGSSLDMASKAQMITAHPFFKMVPKNLDLSCVLLPSTDRCWVACKTRLESRIIFLTPFYL